MEVKEIYDFFDNLLYLYTEEITKEGLVKEIWLNEANELTVETRLPF